MRTANRQPDPPDDAPHDALDEAWSDYLRQVDSGASVDRDRLLAQCGAAAPELRELLRIADLVEKMAGPIGADEEAERERTVDAFLDPSAPPIEHDSDDTHPFVVAGDPQRLDATLSHASQSGRSVHSPALPLPYMLGEYELLEEVGRGGMGVVYKARQRHLDRLVAVKMILSGRFASGDDVQRFYTEAQAAAKLDHPNVVAIYQVGQIDGHHFFSMDFIEGTSVAALTEEGPLPPKRAAAYLALIADAVEFAHRKGILHRDLKPANILIDELDRPLVGDFGLAKYLHEHEGLTASGLALGTPSYMSPEQAEGRHADVGPATDVYALGAILYAMLTGHPPHRGDTPVDTILKVIHREPPPPSEVNPSVRGDIETICQKCLAKEPGDRYASAAELAADLRRFLADEPIEARPAGPLVRAARWWWNLPLVAALSGRRVLEPTAAHRRVQTTMLALVVLMPLIGFALFAALMIARNKMPAHVAIAGGPEDGNYARFAAVLSDALQSAADRPSESIVTDGSGENRERLIERSANLALLQANSVRGPAIAVVAPLYYEATHFIARRDRGIAMIGDLKGKRVVIGLPGSGSQATARTILEHFGLRFDDLDSIGTSVVQLRDDASFDAALLTIGVRSQAIHEVLAHEDFTLLPIEDAQTLSLQHVAYRPFVIERSDYEKAAAVIPEAGVTTVATPAFLATRVDAPDVLVETTLETLYSTESLAAELIPRRFAAEWQGLALHRAARRYYERWLAEEDANPTRRSSP